jgi:SAM-dependent methyltransferase
MEGIAGRLRLFYEKRAAEEPVIDPEALLRFDKALAAAELQPRERVLDVGSKWGGLGLRAREAGLDIDYTGLDLSPANARAAAEHALAVRVADATEPLPLGDATFDCAFCLELLEHLPSAVGLLQELRRVLVQRGRAVVSVPSPYSWVEVYREVFGKPDREGHLNAFTTPVFRNLAALAGFGLERCMGTSVRIPRTLRLIPTDSLLARSRLYVLRAADEVSFAGR